MRRVHTKRQTREIAKPMCQTIHLLSKTFPGSTGFRMKIPDCAGVKFLRLAAEFFRKACTLERNHRNTAHGMRMVASGCTISLCN